VSMGGLGDRSAEGVWPIPFFKVRSQRDYAMEEGRPIGKVHKAFPRQRKPSSRWTDGLRRAVRAAEKRIGGIRLVEWEFSGTGKRT